MTTTTFRPLTADLTVHVTGSPAAQGSKRHVGGGRLIEQSKAVAPWRKAVRAAAVPVRQRRRCRRRGRPRRPSAGACAASRSSSGRRRPFRVAAVGSWWSCGNPHVGCGQQAGRQPAAVEGNQGGPAERCRDDPPGRHPTTNPALPDRTRVEEHQGTLWHAAQDTVRQTMRRVADHDDTA